MTRAATQAEQFDHNRDLLKHEPRPGDTRLDQILADIPKRSALARLVGYCEGIANSGILGPDVTPNFRAIINDVVATHGMTAKVPK